MDDWKRLNYLSPQELKELQNKKLRHFISRKLYPFSPHYRSLFNKHKIKPEYIRTQEDLRIVPFTIKDDLTPTDDNIQRYLDFILQPNEYLIKKYSGINRLLWFALLKLVRGSRYLKKTA